MKLVLDFPPSSNRYWRSTVRGGRVHVYKTDEAKAYQAKAYWMARKQNHTILDGPVIVRGTIYFPNKRGDLTNRIKVLEDAIQGAAYHDDKQVVRIDISKAIDRENPRVELDITNAVEDSS